MFVIIARHENMNVFNDDICKLGDFKSKYRYLIPTSICEPDNVNL